MRRLRSLLLWCLVALCAAVVTLYASASFPTSVKSFTTKAAGDTIQAAHINDIQDEIVAIETALLTGPHPPIVFPASQDASTDVNTLDDYEEGTWTPVIGGNSATSGQSYTTQAADYMKIGKLVVARFVAVLSAKGTITGSVEIQGLPFTVEDTTSMGANVLQFASLATNHITVWAIPIKNTTTAQVQGVTAAATGGTAFAASDIGNTTQLSGTIIYKASQ